MQPIETNRLIIRNWRDTDISIFAEMNADKEVMRFFPSVLTAEESYGFYQRIMAEFQTEPYGLYAIEEKSTGDFLGYVGFHKISFTCDFTGGVEIGWRLKSSCWNQGYATEAAKRVLQIGKELGLKKVFSFTAVVNKPSERVMQKIGLKKEGEFDHPNLPDGHWLRKHILYSIEL